MSDATLSTHVLDLETGQPASGLKIDLLDADDKVLRGGVTDDDGRVSAWPPLPAGTYALRFAVHDWFAAAGRDSFFPAVTVAFIIDGNRPHYHVPLLLNRYGYSTYRGS